MTTVEKYGYLIAAAQCRIIKDKSMRRDRSVILHVCQKKAENQITKNKSLTGNSVVIDTFYYDVICLVVTMNTEKTTADS